MKENILITGTNGYLQNHISHFLKKNDYNTNCISLRNNEWKKKNFKEFDTAIHLAGIVHQKKSINLKNYIDVNARLTYDFAKKCKADGIRHFIFFSTMSVYGENGSLKKEIEIKDKKKTNPNTNYGISKLYAEKLLWKLNDDNFKITIVRPPMIYGKDSPGNFYSLIKIGKIFPIFPKINNKRSAIYIDNLSNYIDMIIRKKHYGILHPQDPDYLSTNYVLKLVAEYFDNKIYFLKIPWLFLSLLNNLTIFKKVYGNLTYSRNIDNVHKDYEEVTLSEALKYILK